MPYRSTFAWTLTLLTIAGCGGKTTNNGPVTTLATLRYSISYLAIDGHDLYWNGDDGVWKMPVSGGIPTVLARRPGSGPLAFDADNVYWLTTDSGTGTSDGAVTKIPRDGATPTTLATGLSTGQVSHIGVNSGGLYYGSGFKIGLNGGAPERIQNSDGCETGAWDFVDETNLYCVGEKVPLDGSPPTALATPSVNGVTDGAVINDATMDANSMYLATFDCRVMKVPLDGSALITLATLPSPTGVKAGFCGASLAVDATNVYATNSYGGGGTGTLLKVPLDGSGTVTTIATALEPGEVVVDATSAYWVDGNGEIFKFTHQ